MKGSLFKIIYSGLLAGFISEGLMGSMFMSPPVQYFLYHPVYQSELFRTITPQRDLVLSVAGMVVLSIIHSVFYFVFYKSIPGSRWYGKGLFWGFTIWLMYWVFQEWFIYHTLLAEPLLLNLLELVILLLGSLAEGLIIARILKPNE